MPELRSTFEQLLGRQPSDREIKSLYRIRDALGIRDNDALWLVLMALQSYDSLYQLYPSMIAGEVRKIVEEQHALIRALAEAEARRAQGALADAVSTASIALASAVAESARYQSWGWLLVGLMGFGGICMLGGAILATGHPPGWSPSFDRANVLLQVFGSIARTPAGWIAAFGGGCAGIASVWQSRGQIQSGKCFGVITSSTCLILASLAMLLLAI